MAKKALKLTIDLVPETCWYKNLRNQVPRSQWDRLRKTVYLEQDNRCRICQATGRLNCHERWEYDDARHVQKLIGFEAVCNMCHHITHFGKARLLSRQGRIDLEAVIEHFMRVNRVDREVFESHKREAFRVWRDRSQHQWQLELGQWAYLLPDRTA